MSKTSLELDDDDLLVLRDMLIYGNVGRGLAEKERAARITREVKQGANRVEQKRERGGRS